MAVGRSPESAYAVWTKPRGIFRVHAVFQTFTDDDYTTVVLTRNGVVWHSDGNASCPIGRGKRYFYDHRLNDRSTDKNVFGECV